MSSSPPAVESLLSRARTGLHRQLGRPVGILLALRDALERLLNALGTPGSEVALAKAGAVAAVAVAAGAVALEPVSTGPTRRLRAGSSRVLGRCGPSPHRWRARAPARRRRFLPSAISP